MTELAKITIASRPRLRRGQLAVGVLQGEAPPVERLSEPLAAAVRQAVSGRGWSGHRRQRASLRGAGEVGTVALWGLGPPGEFDAGRLQDWLESVAAEGGRDAARALALQLPDHELTRGVGAAEAVLRTLMLTGYRFGRHLSSPPRDLPRKIQLLPPPGEEGSYRAALELAEPLARGVAAARDLANTPPNEANPQWMAAAARRLARRRGMKVRVLGERELRRLEMGGLLAVGKGSSAPPRLVRLAWGEGRIKLALVGKGVTFDTGGISIKPAKSMDEMKYDKAGACAVLGIAQAAADLDLPFRFEAYLPLAENMPDGRAYRPGDIVRCRNGKTVEILNTDAEGRMILADALCWAAEGKPDTLLEFSTLTGASVVALGHHAAALYTPDNTLAAELLEAGRRSGERLWRMPLWRECRDEMEGHHADLRNVAGRWGGANTAAAFLSHFVGDLKRWAHVDIAGTAWVGREQQRGPGATGFGVALTVGWLLRVAGRI